VSIIPGLILTKKFIGPEDAARLVEHVDAGQWSSELRRRVQHFGYRYDYRTHHCDGLASAPALPVWALELIGRMRCTGAVAQACDQLIINEYLPGQGIAPHVDSLAVFGEEIASLSLLSPCVLLLRSVDSDEVIPLLLEPGDLLVLRGEARSKWKHGITARKKDRIYGRDIVRQRRLSLTFRTLRA
jgi:alkylated DNA repair dioxygenase AlkB